MVKKQAWRLQGIISILSHPEDLSQFFPCYRSTEISEFWPLNSTYFSCDIYWSWCQYRKKKDLKCSFKSSTGIPVAWVQDSIDTEEHCISSLMLIQTCLILTKKKTKSLALSHIWYWSKIHTCFLIAWFRKWSVQFNKIFPQEVSVFL